MCVDTLHKGDDDDDDDDDDDNNNNNNNSHCCELVQKSVETEGKVFLLWNQQM
jgi:hypothetical protein